MKRRWIFAVIALTIAIVALALWRVWTDSNDPPPGQPASIDHVARALDQLGWKLAMSRTDDGDVFFSATLPDGSVKAFSAESLLTRLESEHKGRSWLNRILNISGSAGMIWVGIGLLGQVLFTGRMIVQWLASERKRQSVVPAAFWWMSLIGASMLIVYFIWRKDIVGILGQGFGWAVYVRNIHLLHTHAKPVRTNGDGQ